MRRTSYKPTEQNYSGIEDNNGTVNLKKVIRQKRRKKNKLSTVQNSYFIQNLYINNIA